MDKDKQILIVSDFTYPNYAGGISKHVYDVCRHMKELKIPVKLISRAKNLKHDFAIDDQSINYDDNNDFHRLDLKIKDLLSFKKMSCVLNYIINSKILIFHTPALGLMLMILAKILGKKTFYFFHGPADQEYRAAKGSNNLIIGIKIRFLMQYFAIKFSDKILFHSEYMKEKTLRYKPNPSKLKYIPPYVDHDKFNLQPPKKDIRDSLGIEKDVKLILVTRRLTRRTGVSQFVEIYKKIRSNLTHDTILWIGGIGDQYEKIKEMEDDHVKVLGWISEKEIGDYIKSANIYVLPSLDLEGFGYVILESLACGVPTIVSESAGGGTDFIKQLDQDLVFKFTLKDISKVINYALKKIEDKNCKKDMNNFTTTYSLDNLCKYYYQL